MTPIAGKTLLPILEGKERNGHESLCWATSGHKAVRMASWKLVAEPKGQWELFDLSQDRAETTNLATQHPERVAAMAKVFEQWHQH